MPDLQDSRFSYQLGNYIILMKNMNDQYEHSLFDSFESNPPEAYNFHHDNNAVAVKGALSMYGNSYYYSLKDKNKKTAIIKFNYELSSY